MRVNRNMPGLPTRPEDVRADNRRRGRVRADLLKTNLGPAVEFSELGIRIRASRFASLTVGAETMLILEGPTGCLATLATVRWTKPDGLFKQLVGLEFLDKGSAFKARLRELAPLCMDLRVYTTDGSDDPLRAVR